MFKNPKSRVSNFGTFRSLSLEKLQDAVRCSLASLARAPALSNHGRKWFVVSKPARVARAPPSSMSRVDESRDHSQQGGSLTRPARSFASGSLRSPSPWGPGHCESGPITSQPSWLAHSLRSFARVLAASGRSTLTSVNSTFTAPSESRGLRPLDLLG